MLGYEASHPGAGIRSFPAGTWVFASFSFILLWLFLKNLPKCKLTHTVSPPCSTPKGEAGTVRKVHSKCGKGHRSRNQRRETAPPEQLGKASSERVLQRGGDLSLLIAPPCPHPSPQAFRGSWLCCIHLSSSPHCAFGTYLHSASVFLTKTTTKIRSQTAKNVAYLHGNETLVPVETFHLAQSFSKCF